MGWVQWRLPVPTSSGVRLSYVRMAKGWMYLVTNIDRFSR
jgi:hypothetical protein